MGIGNIFRRGLSLLNRIRFYVSDLIQSNRNKNKTFSIISNDCWGGEVYKNVKLPFQTPFIGLMIMGPCYIKLLQELKTYLNNELIFIEKSKYPLINELKSTRDFPLGLLKDVEIAFLHFASDEEAYEKWMKRKERINWNNLFIKFDAGKDYATKEMVATFEKLDFKNKLCLTKKPLPEFSTTLFVKDWEENGANMYRKTLRNFDVVNWLNHRQTKPSFMHRMLYALIHKKIGIS